MSPRKAHQGRSTETISPERDAPLARAAAAHLQLIALQHDRARAPEDPEQDRQHEHHHRQDDQPHRVDPGFLRRKDRDVGEDERDQHGGCAHPQCRPTLCRRSRSAMQAASHPQAFELPLHLVGEREAQAHGAQGPTALGPLVRALGGDQEAVGCPPAVKACTVMTERRPLAASTARRPHRCGS